MSDALQKVIILAAPSGAGKTTITKYLLERFPRLAFSISATTRTPRGAEQDGVEYHFLSLAKFEGLIEQNEFLEYEQVYEGVYYGTLKSELTRIWALGKVPVLDIDVKGAIRVQEQLGDKSLSIFIMPPSVDTLRERLLNRQTETAASIQTRIDKAEYEISFSNQFNAIIKNEVLETACTDVANLLTEFLGPEFTK
jgi:guanylate kinase